MRRGLPATLSRKITCRTRGTQDLTSGLIFLDRFFISPQGPVFAGDECGHPEFPMLVLYLLSLAHTSVISPPPPGLQWWLQAAEARSPKYG